jgi:hypothetical protein
MVARKLSGMPDNVARAVCGGMRFKDIDEKLRKITRLRAPDDYAAVDGLLKQLGVISDFRDGIAHRTATVTPRGLFVHNHWTTKTAESPEEDIYDLKQIKAMEYDCVRIFSTFGLLLLDRKMRDFLLKRHDLELAVPDDAWLYRPPQRGGKKKNRRASPQ